MADTKNKAEAREGEEGIPPDPIPPFPSQEQVTIARANTYVSDPADLVEIPPTEPPPPISPPPPPPPVSRSKDK